jgi:hypothetical protein
MILQICYCIYLLLGHEATCLQMIEIPRKIAINEDLVDYLIDLLYDRNVQIRQVCDEALLIIAVLVLLT